jgi:hypothetical protein
MISVTVRRHESDTSFRKRDVAVVAEAARARKVDRKCSIRIPSSVNLVERSPPSKHRADLLGRRFEMLSIMETQKRGVETKNRCEIWDGYRKRLRQLREEADQNLFALTSSRWLSGTRAARPAECRVRCLVECHELACRSPN